jgi:hypothetical protein
MIGWCETGGTGCRMDHAPEPVIDSNNQANINSKSKTYKIKWIAGCPDA